MEWAQIFHDITSRHDFSAMHDFLEKNIRRKLYTQIEKTSIKLLV